MMSDRESYIHNSKIETENDNAESLNVSVPPAALDSEAYTLSSLDESDQPDQQLLSTRVSEDSVKDYLSQIGRTTLLSAEQEVELAGRIEAGLMAEQLLEGRLVSSSSIDASSDELLWLVEDGRQAKEHFIEANLRLVASLARRKIGRNVSYLELIQDGTAGMIHAVEKFDHTEGVKFSTYATWWIRQALEHSVAAQAYTIKIPFNVHERLNAIRRGEQYLRQEINREPTIEELAIETGLTPEEIEQARESIKNPISLHQPLGEDQEGEFGDLIENTEFISPEDATVNVLRNDALLFALDFLPDRDADILKMRFGLGGREKASLSKIGKVYGISASRVSGAEQRAMKMLSDIATQQGLRNYLE